MHSILCRTLNLEIIPLFLNGLINGIQMCTSSTQQQPYHIKYIIQSVCVSLTRRKKRQCLKRNLNGFTLCLENTNDLFQSSSYDAAAKRYIYKRIVWLYRSACLCIPIYMHDKLAEQYIIGFNSFPFLFYKLKNKA